MVEMFEIYDAENRPAGLAPRKECHGNPALRHRAAQVMIQDSCGRWLLQHRSTAKDIQPGKWDTAVGGHLQPGENYEQAARREMTEELGKAPGELHMLFDLEIRNEIESEDLRVFRCIDEGPFEFQRSEISEVRWFTREELASAEWAEQFTPNLRRELKILEIS